MPTKNTLPVHARLALEIKAAKKKMFRNHREGMPLRDAAEKFATEISARIQPLLLEETISSSTNAPSSVSDNAALSAQPAEAKTGPVKVVGGGDLIPAPYMKVIELGLGYMIDRLQAGESGREAATSLLCSLSSRFDEIEKPDFHGRLGYDHNASQIHSNLNRTEKALSYASNLTPTHGRIDAVMSELLEEVTRLARSQSTFCESCEHCIRERFPDGDQLLGIGIHPRDTTIDAALWPKIAERFTDLISEAEAQDEVIVVLRRVESMVWAERPGAVREVINQLVDSLVAKQVNNVKARDGYERNALAGVKEAIRDMDENEARDDA